MRIGTRGSALALAQAQTVADALGGELVTIMTAGDQAKGVGDKSRWTSALEQALLAGEVDVCVHSAKDVPGELADGCVLAGAPARADARDVLVGAGSLSALPPGARVGTSALRRSAQLLAAREDLEVVELRGNVDTRLLKLSRGDVDALVLALAGLERLGRTEEAGAPLDDFVPAPGQGVLALETRADDDAAQAACEAITDPATWSCLSAERACVVALGATCETPVGAHAVPVADSGGFRLRAFAGRPDGSAWMTDELAGDDPVTLGEAVAARMLAAGVREVLEP